MYFDGFVRSLDKNYRMVLMKIKFEKIIMNSSLKSTNIDELVKSITYG